MNWPKTLYTSIHYSTNDFGHRSPNPTVVTKVVLPVCLQMLLLIDTARVL
jgi:hypothetical protein